MREEELQYCINICWSCRHACQQALYNWYLPSGNVKIDADHLKIMTDCIQISQIVADFMTRNSKYSDQLRAICAKIADDCDASCERHEHAEMQHCAELCRKCAMYCRGEN